ncbi:hypothetical protein Pcinc_037087, partial [Petrolisthes cinctipes]
SSDPGDVEYAELTFSNGKSKNKKNKKKSGSQGANGTIPTEDDSTIYAVIDHARTAQQTTHQRNNKAGGKQALGGVGGGGGGGGNNSTTTTTTDPCPLRQPDEIPLMHALTLESSV